MQRYKKLFEKQQLFYKRVLISVVLYGVFKPIKMIKNVRPENKVHIQPAFMLVLDTLT